MHNVWWINSLLLVPLLGAVAVVATRRVPRAAYGIGVATASLELVIAAVVTLLYSWHNTVSASCGAKVCTGFSLLTTEDFAHRWVLAPSFGLAYDVAIDGLSLFLVLLTAIVVLLALLGARESKHEAAFVGWLLVLMTATMGSFVSSDLLEFFLFFELTLIPSYFLIAHWGGKERSKAALKFFVYTLFGSGFLFVGLIYLAFSYQHAHGGDLTFSYLVLQHAAISHSAAVWVFVAFAIAFGVKSPIFPLHTWSPLAYAEAPIAGSMVLSALLAKLGTYGLLRYGVFLLPQAVHTLQPYLLTLAVIGILYGSALSAMSKDMKRLVAYSSMAQVGFIILGVMSGSSIAITGAVLLMFNHGVITAGFFLLIGFIEKRRGTSEVTSLAGLQRPAPVLAALFTVVMLASIGLPGLSGFVSEYLVLIGTFSTHTWWAVVATLGVVLAALYLLWAYQRIFHGRAEGENAEMPDLSHRERWIIAPLIVLILFIGVYPKPVLDRISPTVNHHVLILQQNTVTK